MPGWGSEVMRFVRAVEGVRCYLGERLHVLKFDGYERTMRETDADPWRKTFVLEAESQDGEYIDLFELQDWFDANREWIDSLRTEAGLAPKEPHAADR